MSTSNTGSSSIEQLPANIPHLKPNGTNWAIFLMHFKEALQASHCWPYFDGLSTCLIPADKDNISAEENKAMDTWDYDDLITRYLLSQQLPDTTTIHLSHYNMAKECWDKVSEEYMAKSTYTQNNLDQAFLEMHCVKGADIHTFLSNLQYKCKELAAAGVNITDHNYQWTVLCSIPDELTKFASGLLLSACIVSPSATINTDTLINHICKKLEQLKNWCRKDQQGRGGGK
jgi:hypothetical protein